LGGIIMRRHNVPFGRENEPDNRALQSDYLETSHHEL
jgi:hypothetical protein